MADPPHDEVAYSRKVRGCLERILTLVARPGTMTEMLAHVHNELWEVLDASNLYVALYDEESCLYVFPYDTDQNADADLTPQRLARSLTDYVRRSNEPLLCTDAGHLWLVEQGEVEVVGTLSPVWLGVPMPTDHGVIGVISIQSYVDAAAYQARDLGTLALVGRCIAYATRQRWMDERHTAEDVLRLRSMVASRDQAVAKNQAKTRFLAEMSHELRTPLTSIVGYAQLLTEQLAEIDAPQLHEAVQIERASRLLAALVDDVLDLSRIEADEAEINPQLVDLDAVLDQVVAIATPAVAAGGNRLLTTPARGLGRVLCDPVRMQQILVNLVANAARHTQGGQITVRARLQGNDLHLDVSDTGEGIPPERLDAIFEPFVQGHDTDSPTGGAGLGLAIVRGLCERMGGTCSAASIPGRGSTFTARLRVGRP